MPPSVDRLNGPGGLDKADRDIVAMGIAVAACLLFVGIGGAVMPMIVKSWLGTGRGPDTILANALLLNIALIIFGWRRYRDLRREVAERRQAEEAARRLSEIDPLTGCLNRRSGIPAMESLCADAARRSREVAVMMLDLDNFKAINDFHGHRAGDAALVEIAARLLAMMPANGVLARFGGDEFLCAVEFDSQSRDDIDRFVARMIDRISAPLDAGGIMLEPTLSIGIAACSMQDGASDARHAAVHRADIAMYHTKKNGRNRYAWFEAHMETDLRQRHNLERAVRRGVQQREFVPYYEQQIDLQTGRLAGFEMLARWHCPEFADMGPEMFIPVAEDLDLISDLSEQLIGQALRDAAEWHPDLTLSVNISPVQLRDPGFDDRLLKLLTESDFPPERLEIEITESCLHENIAAVHTIVTGLKAQGIQISLDDFGTGYSSLSQLRALPFDRIKIDRSFVRELTRDEEQTNLVRAIVSLGRGLSLPLTAEGVETDTILQLLKEMGPLKGQGYHYGLPESAESTRRRLDAMGLLAPPAHVSRTHTPATRKAS